MKGVTKWFERCVYPAQNGFYECRVRLVGGVYALTMLEWDGNGFRTDGWPLQVIKWRGQTKKAYFASTGETV